MSFQTVRCVLCASEEMRQKVWLWTEKYTLLVNELLDQVASHEKFPEWQAQGSIARKEVEILLKPLKESDQFNGLPGRFYTSAVLMVQYTYLAWLALQKKRHFKIIGKQRWLEVLEADLEMASNTDFEWQEIQSRAFELLAQTKNSSASVSAKPVKRGAVNQEAAKIQKQTPFNALLERFFSEKDLLSRRAIAHLLRNNLQVDENEESLDELLFRFEKKRIKIERIKKQLESRRPKGRDPVGTRFVESIEEATALPEHTKSEEIEAELNGWKHQKQVRSLNSLPYPVLFVSITDLIWSLQSNENEQESVKGNQVQPSKRGKCKKKQKRSPDRICVNFNGFKKFLGETQGVFKIQCDRRQLPIFRQIVSDWKAYQQLPDDEKYGLGLMLLKSAQLTWKKDQQKLYKKKAKNRLVQHETAKNEQLVYPWQTHRLYLHCCINSDLLTAEGTDAVQQQKLSATGKKLEGLKKRKAEVAEQIQISKTEEDSTTLEKLQTDLENRIAANATSLERLQRSTPQRHSKPAYQGQPQIIVGVSFSREQPVGVAVVDTQTGGVIEYQSTRLLLSNPAVKAKPGGRTVTQLRLEKYRLVNRRQRQQQQNAIRRSKEQKQNRYSRSKSESNLGQYLDRLIASRIVKLAIKWQASSIVVPNLGDIRESVEASLKAEAERKFPNEFERQKKYAKRIRSSFHAWSYGRLTECIKSCASRAQIPVEQGYQPTQGDLKEKAMQVALHAYYTRQ